MEKKLRSIIKESVRSALMEYGGFNQGSINDLATGLNGVVRDYLNDFGVGPGGFSKINDIITVHLQTMSKEIIERLNSDN
jgi:hypothetical protein